MAEKVKQLSHFVRVKHDIYVQITELAKLEDRSIGNMANQLLKQAISDQKTSKT